MLIVIRAPWSVVREDAALTRHEFLWGFAQAGEVRISKNNNQKRRPMKGVFFRLMWLIVIHNKIGSRSGPYP